MNDEAPPLGSVYGLVVEPEPDPRFGPENAVGRDRLEFALYLKLQSVAYGPDALQRTEALALECSNRLAARMASISDPNDLARMMANDYEFKAIIVLVAALRNTAGAAECGYRWRLVPRGRVDHDALAVEVAASRARVNRWLAI